LATFVFFHAHPDDEAIGSGGTIAALAAAGHRVVVLLATGGERGIVPEDLDEADLAELRGAEAGKAADVLGAARVAFLGYVDSGEEPTDPPPGSFADADLDEAAARVVELLRHEAADALIIYDANGITGHPDHVQVHRVGVRAGMSLPGVRVYEGTLSESQLVAFGDTITEFALASGAPAPSGNGPVLHASPDEAITTSVDAGPWLARKRAAMAAHASQIGPDSFFLATSDEQFARVFGVESYIDHSATSAGPGPLEVALADSGAIR